MVTKVQRILTLVNIKAWISECSPWKPRATPESPTCPMYNLPCFIIAILAVVPDVLGNPLRVLGHLSEIIENTKHLQYLKKKQKKVY